MAIAPLSLLEEDFSGNFPPSGWTSFSGEGEADAGETYFPGNQDWSVGSLGGNSVAFVFGEDIEDGLAQDWLVTTLLQPTVANSTLSFDALTFPGNAPTNFAIQVSTDEQADQASYETVAAYTSDDFTGDFQTFEVDLSAYTDESIYVGFVMENDDGDTWVLDNVEGIPLAPDVLVSVPGEQFGLSEGGTEQTLIVELTTAPTEAVSVSFTTDTTEVTAVQPLTFTPTNWETPQLITFTAVQDDLDEGEEAITVGVEVSSTDPAYNAVVAEDIEGTIVDAAIPFFSSYRTVEETYGDLEALAADNPTLATWTDIGDTYDKLTPGGPEGYDIFALKLTNEEFTPADGDEKPVFYMQAAIHAREYTTTELVARFAEELVAGYGVDPDTTWLLDYNEIHIVPIVNPDGRKIAEQGYLWRKNTNPNPQPGAEPAPFPTYGVDLNRNYGFEWANGVAADGTTGIGSSDDPASTGYHGSGPFSEPESTAASEYVATLFEPNGPELLNDPTPELERIYAPVPDDISGIYIDYHSFAEAILYSWGWAEGLIAPNDEELSNLARRYSFFTGAVGEPYDALPAQVFGAVGGATDDWAYATFGIPGLTLEIGTSFFQPSEDFENEILPDNIPAMYYTAKAARRPYQTPFGPEVLGGALARPQVTAGTAVELTAIADDARYADSDAIGNGADEIPSTFQNIAAGRYSIDEPSWIPDVELFAMTVADGTFDSAVESLTATIDTTDFMPGRYTIFVEGQDADGNWGVPTAVFLDIVPTPANATVMEGSALAETLVGQGQPDVIYALGGDDTVAGGLGNDVLFGEDGDDVLRGDRNSRNPGGAAGGDDIIYGGNGSDRIGGKSGNDSLYGDAGDDFIWGDDGDDLIWGGRGNDVLTGDDNSGGSGSDTFVLAFGDGTDTITDFEVGTDLIGLFGTLNFGQLSVSQAEQNAQIEFGDETLAILLGIEAEALTESSFVLA
ncbi:M14 family zinc carboxypeptidase [Synechococcus sp. PCC 7335]|uniref:M14 family zinc carboxypeptidase n=1 Tax=Synechococcus sp. (strain ATCC 29403 / PCC 7335) TaxID=91464 RepID=UPI0018DCA5A1|nr:M14 family zinc carboxypeptidase [Synechococcus sp. PCC 7335]